MSMRNIRQIHLSKNLHLDLFEFFSIRGTNTLLHPPFFLLPHMSHHMSPFLRDYALRFTFYVLPFPFLLFLSFGPPYPSQSPDNPNTYRVLRK